MTQQLEDYLYSQGLQARSVDRICGFLAAKPKRWTRIFMMRCEGRTQREIASALGTSQSAIARVIKKIQGIISKCDIK